MHIAPIPNSTVRVTAANQLLGGRSELLTRRERTVQRGEGPEWDVPNSLSCVSVLVKAIHLGSRIPVVIGRCLFTQKLCAFID